MFWGRKLVKGEFFSERIFITKYFISLFMIVEYLHSSPTPANSSTAVTDTDNSEASNDKYLQSLEKQLTIEMKVKNGTENMIQSISQNYQSRDKKLLAEAYTMLEDSKAKIEFLKLKILKVKQNRQMNKVSLQIITFLLSVLHLTHFVYYNLDFRERRCEIK